MRFAAAKVHDAPALGQVTPGGTTSLVGNLGVATGNPFLEPTRAKTYDLAAEWYFDEGALLSAALYYKDIDTFVQTLVESMPFNQSGYPMELLAGTSLERHGSVRVLASGEHRGRASQGLRDQLPAAVQVPARRVEQSRRVVELHVRRFGDRLRDRRPRAQLRRSRTT
jgi:outer membrane receptor protein involved in Fe transport